MLTVVITTINAPTPQMWAWRSMCSAQGWGLVIVGDTKTPDRWDGWDGYVNPPGGIRNHYARKNIGYDMAVGMTLESDDDNAPLPHLPEMIGSWTSELIAGGERWYTPHRVGWNRGYKFGEPSAPESIGRVALGVIQFGHDGEADWDAVSRLSGARGPGGWPEKVVGVLPGTFTAFNSQCTLWPGRAPHLPSDCSMRACDILRGYRAQEEMWLRGLHVGHGPAGTVQVRNEHDLLDDLQQELTVYKAARERV